MRVFLLLIAFGAILGCANQQNTSNSRTSTSTQPTNIVKWEFEKETDDFTEKQTCVVRHIKEYSSDIGISNRRVLSITGAPNQKSSALSITFDEKERVRAFDPDFGMINQGPYTPWPRLSQNADVRVGDVVDQAFLVRSNSEARDVYTSGVWERFTEFSLPGKLVFEAGEGETLSVRIKGTIYKAPLSKFQQFKGCLAGELQNL